MARSVEEAIALHQQLGRRPGEPDDEYRERLREVAALIGPDQTAYVEGILLPRWAAMWSGGPYLAATTGFRQELLPKEEAKFAELHQALRKLRAAYDDITWKFGTNYWRALRDRGPEAAEEEMKGYLQKQGMEAAQAAALARQMRQEAQDASVAMNTTMAVVNVVLTTTIAALQVVPVVGWVVGAALALVQVLMNLGAYFGRREIEKRKEAWDEFERNKQAWHVFDLGNRREGEHTYRGFLVVPGVSPDTYTFEDGVAVVNRRLYTLSLASGVDWSVAFPLLPFGTVVDQPYLIEGLPDMAEGDALEIARRRELGPAALVSGVPAAQAWYERGYRGELGSPSSALDKIPQFDAELGSGGPDYFYWLGYVEARAGLPARRITAEDVGERGAAPEPVARDGARAQHAEARRARSGWLMLALAALLLGT